MENRPEQPAPAQMPPPVVEGPPPPKVPGRGMFVLVLVLAIVALIASLSSLVLVLTAAPSPAPGDGGGTAEAALIWGHAVVVDCSEVQGSFVFKIQYANVGGTTATDVTAQYTVYQFDDPTIIQTGTVSIGTVEAGTTGSITEPVPLICGFWGHNVEVSFSWT